MNTKKPDLEAYLRFIGKQIPCNTGGTFENDPPDAILDAAVRALHQKQKLEYAEQCQEKELRLLEYNIERTKVFEKLAEVFYHSSSDDIDGIKKIYEIVRAKYPIGTYYPPAN